MDQQNHERDSELGPEKNSSPRRPWWWVLWAIGMLVALVITAFLIVKIVNLNPDIWTDVLEERVLTLIGIIATLMVIIVLLAIGGTSLGWTGFGERKLWDWLQLISTLAIPVVLAAAGFWFAANQEHHQQQAEALRAESDQRLQQQRARDATLQSYLSQMSELVLNRHLLESEQGDSVYTLAQARTATVMTRLDADHNKDVMHFLMNSGLARKSPSGDELDQRICAEKTPTEESSINLLSGVDLSGANLSGVNLTCADLSGAILYDADLSGAFLSGADLSGALLNDASLSDAYLYGADLSSSSLYAADMNDALLYKADLSSAILSSYNDYWGRVRGVSDKVLAQLNTKGIVHADPKDAADLSGATLNGANFSGAFVHGVDMSGADLQGTYVTKDGSDRIVDMDQLAHETSSLEGATMPNGQKYEDWLKSKGSGEDGGE